MAVEKGKGARIVVIDRDGTVLMDSKKSFLNRVKREEKL